MSDQKSICANCVGEPFLSRQILTGSASGKCDYCGAHLVGLLPLDELAKRFDVVLSQFFISGNPEPGDRSWTMPRGKPLDDVVQELLDLSDEDREDLTRELHELWFDNSTHEDKYGDDPHFIDRSKFGESLSREWGLMNRSLARESRFLNPKVQEVMSRVFCQLSDLRTTNGEGVTVPAGPGTKITKIVRARVFQSPRELISAMGHPERFLGPPPAGTGRSGRMNAQGIPVFYGSLEHEIAIAEIRPPVGSFVAVAQFEIIRPLQLLDFHRLRTLFSTGSPFDPKAFEAIERDQFLAVLESMITRPVMPENEHHDYLVTQAMADYLANHPEVNLDGVVFRSAQVAPGVFPANNVTLFQKSAGVELSEERFGPTADFRLYEIDEGGARIHPEIQWLSDTEKPRTNRLFDLIYGSEPEKTALRLIRDSVEIRIVEAATYKTYPYRLQQASNG